MEKNLKILSDITTFSKYAKYISELGRRETFREVVERNRDMHLKTYKDLPAEFIQEIADVYENFVMTRKILPSMRSMQFAGKPIEISPNRIYNCGYAPIDSYHVFGEIMFLLLGGTGIGFSVQKHHVEKLPPITIPTKRRRYLINDSIEGWADAVKMLVRAYLCGRSLPLFDYSDIREKGAPLITSGGKAPGPEPLRTCLHHIKMIFERKENGEQLTPLEAHDIVCHIADAVLAGGIRRAACISLFSLDDEEMLTCKFGNWWETNPQRARANNSAVVLRHRVQEEDFNKLWLKIKASGSGEPGIYLTHNSEWMCNPCAEISLRAFQFCNLVEINMSNIESQEDLNARSRAASLIATLQAGYTDFHYLRDIWKRTTEREALIGVSGTGIASMEVFKYNLKISSKEVIKENKRVAAILGIKEAARATCVKPAGTSSLVLGTSSGIHAWFDRFYIRRIRLGKDEALYQYLAENHPALVEDEFFKPKTQAVVSIPVMAPEGAVVSTEETPLELLERIKRFHNEWIKPGHRIGDNTHNVSATIYLNGDEEWEEARQWMWDNREVYNGLSVFPKDLGEYIQAPHESISKEVFDEMIKLIEDFDITQVKEINDNTDLSGEVACAGGVCELR